MGWSLAVRQNIDVDLFRLTFDLLDANGATAGGHDQIGGAFGIISQHGYDGGTPASSPERQRAAGHGRRVPGRLRRQPVAQPVQRLVQLGRQPAGLRRAGNTTFDGRHTHTYDA